MKKVSRRALFALALAIVLAAGTLAFCVKYAVNADKWVTFSGSPHVYTGTNLTGGKIYDRTGARILNTTDGRVYSSDAAVRAATVHLLGDRYGYISAPLLGNFAEQMIGYDKITGLSEASKGTASARLTISADVQKAALQALGSYHGTVGVYNYKTGEILCAVTSPSYDPDNIPDIAGDETGDYDGVYLNRFFDAAYTPGSIFKLVTSAAALEADAASKDQTYTCAGALVQRLLRRACRCPRQGQAAGRGRPAGAQRDAPLRRLYRPLDRRSVGRGRGQRRLGRDRTIYRPGHRPAVSALHGRDRGRRRGRRALSHAEDLPRRPDRL